MFSTMKLCSSIFFFIFLIFSAHLRASSAATQCNAADQAALLAIKSHFNNAYHFASWTSNTACCNWYGVDCDFSAGGRVTGVRVFADNDLAGTLPPELGNLPFLTTILFHNLPKLVGNIPSTITKLSKLSLLDLSQNSLSGPVPSFLSQLPSVTDIDLSRNKFSGTIPPSLSQLTTLAALHLDHNQLTGSIPASFGSFPKASPPDLYLSNNMLSSIIPTTLGNPNWGIIDLSRNQLLGDASFLFGATKQTTQMDLSYNGLSFDLTKVSFPTQLTYLDLSHNSITGSIPAQINQVTGLALFNVSYDELCGPIPAGAVTAKFDQYSYIGNKCLCGKPLASC